MAISLDRLNVFFQVVKYGNYLKASEHLGIKSPAISHQIASLEADFGVSLLIRNKAGIKLTAQGENLYNILKQGLPSLAAIEDVMGKNSTEPKGNLSVMTWFGLSTYLLTRFIKDFLELYPEIKLHVIGNFSEEDFLAKSSDVLINTYVPNRPDLVQLKLFSAQFKAYASVDYIKEHGMPKKFEDLDHHRLISIAQDIPKSTLDLSEWILTKERPEDQPRKPYLTINSITGCAALAQQGLGIVNLPNYHSELLKDSLVDIFPHYKPAKTDFYYIYPKYLDKVKRVRVFGEFLKQRLKNYC